MRNAGSGIYICIYIYTVDLLQIMLTLPKAHSLLLLLLQLLFFFCLPYAARAKPDSGQPIQCDIVYIVSIAYAMPHGAHTCAYISIYTLCMQFVAFQFNFISKMYLQLVLFLFFVFFYNLYLLFLLLFVSLYLLILNLNII